MKNLSKVLAVVLSFMLVFTTVGAASYTDVAADAKYNEAVSVLSSLNILKGYEDGSFKPEGNITRAEFAAVVCRLLGLEETANGAKGQQVFNDVAGDHWASGYVALASQQGIINGYGDGNFGPEDNVLYEQAIKMIVAALGYTPMADVNGGYPGGYQIVAAQRGILANVSGGATGVAATRAIVAQMSYNALEVPIMGQTSFGTDVAFSATDELLLNKLNVTKFEGTIEQTPSSDEKVKDGKVQVKYDRQISAVTDNYTAQRYRMDDAEEKANPADVYGTIVNATYKRATINVADDIKATAESYLDYSVVMFVENATDSDATLLAVFPKAAALSDLTFKTKDVYSSKTDYKAVSADDTVEGTIAVYTDKDADKYEKYDVIIEKVYINGRQQTSTKVGTIDAGTSIKDEDSMKAVLDYYLDPDVDADVKLVCNTSGEEYNIAYITEYQDLVVESINEKTMSITGKTSEPKYNLINRIKFSEDYEGRYTIVKDGAPATFADIKVDDVLSVAGYINSSRELEYGTVIITSEKASGTVTTYDDEDETVTVGGKAYDYNAYIGTMLGKTGANGISLGDEVTLYINARGYVVDIDKTASSSNLKYGFATKVVKSTGVEDSWQIRILTTDGAWTTFNFASKVSFDDAGSDSSTSITSDTMKDKLKANIIDSKIVVNGIVAYETNSSNEINKIYANASKDTEEKFNYAEADNKDYIASTDGLGSIYLDDNTVIFSTPSGVDLTTTAIDEDDVSVAKKDALVDRESYTANGYGIDDEGYAKVLCGKGLVGEISLASNFFVISSKSNTTNDDGDEGYLLEGYVQGEVVSVFADKLETTVIEAAYDGKDVDLSDDDSITAADLAKGDVILYSKTANGEADKVIRLVANANVKTILDNLDGDTTLNGDGKIKLAAFTSGSDDYTFYFGFAYDRSGSRLKLAAKADANQADDALVILSGSSVIGASVDNYASKLKVADAAIGDVDTDDTGDATADLVFIRTKYDTTIEDVVIYDYED